LGCIAVTHTLSFAAGYGCLCRLPVSNHSRQPYLEAGLHGPLLLPQALLQASVELPSGASRHYPAQDVTLVAYFADATADSGRKLMPVALNFREYWQEVLVGYGAAPALPGKVYRMHPRLAEQGWERRWLYTAAGGVVSRGPEGLLSLHKVRLWLPAVRDKMGWS